MNSIRVSGVLPPHNSGVNVALLSQMYLRQIHTKDVFGPSLRQIRTKVKGQGHQGQKRHFGPSRRPTCGLCLVKHL